MGSAKGRNMAIEKRNIKDDEKPVLRYPLIPSDADVEGLGVPWRGKLCKLLSFSQFFTLFIATEIPCENEHESAILEELCDKFSEIKAGNEPEIREVAHATLLETMLRLKNNGQGMSMNPHVFLQCRRFFAAIAAAPTERRKIQEAGTDEDRELDEETTNEETNEGAAEPVRQTA